MHFNDSIKTVTAFAPATIGNFCVGYDILGCCTETVGDEVTLTRDNSLNGVVIEEIISDDQLPLDPQKNVASYAAQAFCTAHKLPMNFSIRIKKGIPLGSGMGGSAASAVAALTALNAFLSEPVSLQSLLGFAMSAEAIACGSPHADNVAPCLYGGLTLTQQLRVPRVIKLPTPNLFCVLVNPKLSVNTQDARHILPSDFPVQKVVRQSEYLATFMVALYENRLDLLEDCFDDVLVEPHRAALVAGFLNVKLAALKAGALGATLSGSGPTVFALAKSMEDAKCIKTSMISAFKASGVKSQGWVSPISDKGAYVK